MSKADRPDHPGASARFNEEKATYTVKGTGEAPDLEAGVAAIRNVLTTLPARPGVYRMQDARGDVLYVGKARALKQRVTNYTQVARLPKRLQRMIAQTRSMTIITTRTEAEALLLEAQLIKRFRPPYNVLLRDDKSFPFILLREDHPFARVQKHRGARRAKGQYFGPFASAGSVTRTLNALQKLFLLRSCSDSFFANRSRPCLLYQIRRCSAPCVGRIEVGAYGELVEDAKNFLAGKSTGVQARLGKSMADAAEAQDYELAAIYRDRLRALTYIQGSQTVHAEGLGDADIFALACSAGQMCIQAFFIRGGQNWGHRAFFPAHTNDVPEDEVFTSFLVQFYEDMPPPRRILVDRDLTEAELLCEALSERAERKVGIERPQRGDRRKLVEQAKRNAEEALERRLAESTTQGKLLRELADTFELPDLPKRIEVYDNSHIMGTNATGAMIVAGPEGFRKNSYRKFNIKSGVTPGDDFGMMREVLERRFARLEKDDPDRASGEWPDLILIDGGKGQLSAVCEIMENAGVHDIPVVGVAKGPHHGREGREVFHLPGGREITLPPNAPLLFYLQRLRDEAHRFAIGTHRAKRAKSLTTSTLDEVPGIGPNRKRALLMHFGTARAVKGAALEDLERAPGVSKGTARQLYDYFHPRG
ncbi:MAG: excinuclease ABC subunit UvrC [Sphingomonadales bacterium]|nr:excinuclease ABC subunit UvrC [Sphingomonadales bacterium]